MKARASPDTLESRTLIPLAVALIIACALVVVLAGCAIAPMPDGSGYSVGVRMAGTGASAQEMGGAAGSVLTALGVPGGSQIGTLLGGALGVLGIGAAAHYKGRETGWDQRTAAASPPPPLPLPSQTAPPAPVQAGILPTS